MNAGKKWIETVKTVAFVIVLTFSFKAFALEHFHIPTGSMMPTLLVGDHLFVGKYAYGYSQYSFPLRPIPFSGRIGMSDPQRGDVIVFKLPSDNSTDYIKRLIGLPGDKVRMQGGRLFINGRMVERERIEAFRYREAAGGVRRTTRYKETLPGGSVHDILEEGDNESLDNTREFVVPPGHYFMMGDNRDNSDDSRAGVGYVPAENLLGRAEFLFYSIDQKSVIGGFELPFGLRLSRFLKPIG